VAGLLQGLDADLLEVRYECGAALARLLSSHPELRPDPAAIWDAVAAELARPPEAAPQARHRLEHVFNLLSTVLEREPLRIAYFAVQSQESIRGTALEYLENVLPERVRPGLLSLIGAGIRPLRPAAPRPSAELAQELLRSSAEIRDLGEPPEGEDEDSKEGPGTGAPDRE
jgi:hypothetical protein